jgi:hypothetical protein
MLNFGFLAARNCLAYTENNMAQCRGGCGGNMDGIALVIFLALVVEKLIELFKELVYAIPFFPDKLKPLTLELISLAFGIVLALGSGLNAMELMNVQFKYSLLGMILTGLVIGKGASFAHDFFHLYRLKK